MYYNVLTLKQDVFDDPDNGQIQRWSRSQKQIGRSSHKKC